MLKRMGVTNRLDLVLLLSLALLVVITPLGNEGTHPLVLGLYRILLFAIIGICTVQTRKSQLPAVCPYFLGCVAVVLLAMYGSVVLRSGSHFEGIYNFYQNALFLIAFIAVSAFSRTRSTEWKRSILGIVVLTDIVYLITATLQRVKGIPLQGPFVNPNYFASYLMVGFAICIAAVLFAKTLRTRIAAIAGAVMLFYGIGQTSSRGVFLSVIVLSVFGLVRSARQHQVPLLRIALAGILIALIAIAANPALIRKFKDRGEHDPYNYGRTQIWMETLSMIATHPVLGVGLGRYYYVSKLFTPSVEGAIGHYRKWPNIAHNEYLQYTAELGVPVALLMFAIGFYLFRLAWKRAETSTPENRIFQEAAMLAAVGLGVHALVDNNWTVPVLAAGMVTIGLADLLPYRDSPRMFAWTPVRLAALCILCIAVFVQAVKIPVIGLYFNEAGHRAYNAGDFQRAEQMHRVAVGILPDHPLLLDNLGMVYLDGYTKTHKVEYLDRAESLFRDSMAANPSFDVPAGHLETALLQRLTGNVAKDQPIHAAIVDADGWGLRANPYNPFIRRNLAEALYNLGRKQEAFHELQNAVTLEPNYVQGYMRLAQWSDESGRTDVAEAYRKKAVAVVVHYKDQTDLEPFEALLLDRPHQAAKP